MTAMIFREFYIGRLETAALELEAAHTARDQATDELASTKMTQAAAEREVTVKIEEIARLERSILNQQAETATLIEGYEKQIALCTEHVLG
eukprot:SAG31_NODE_5539_length_2468_cov_1.853103_4_plen_90_part_01